MTGGWQQSFTGRQFWPLDLQVEHLDIRDIAHSLSLQCRYGGHSRRHYSVAEHSLLVAELCACVTASGSMGTKLELAALMHDASEAYLLDLPRPLKKSIDGYEEIEERCMRVISEKWGFSYPLPEPVKVADQMAVSIEKRALFGIEAAPWSEVPEPPVIWRRQVSPEDQNTREVEDRFLNRFYELCEWLRVLP
jgi:hypothetical protein